MEIPTNVFDAYTGSPPMTLPEFFLIIIPLAITLFVIANQDKPWMKERFPRVSAFFDWLFSSPFEK